MESSNRVIEWWRGLFKRRRLSLINTRGGKELWHTHISVASIAMAILSLFIFISALMLTLVGYTPILNILPKYRGEAERQRSVVVESIMRIDSMERVIGEMMLYADNVALIMNDKTPIVREDLSTSTPPSLSKSILPPSRIDSLLRAQMEGDTPYNLSLSTFRGEEQMIAPVEGIVVNHFDISKECYGVDVVASTQRVMAAQRGVVVMCEWRSKGGYTIALMHPRGLLSLYRNVANPLVKVGENVKVGSVIGDSRAVGDMGDERAVIRFEIWNEGTPVDPEIYVMF